MLGARLCLFLRKTPVAQRSSSTHHDFLLLVGAKPGLTGEDGEEMPSVGQDINHEFITYTAGQDPAVPSCSGEKIYSGTHTEKGHIPTKQPASIRWKSPVMRHCQTQKQNGDVISGVK